MWVITWVDACSNEGGAVGVPPQCDQNRLPRIRSAALMSSNCTIPVSCEIPASCGHAGPMICRTMLEPPLFVYSTASQVLFNGSAHMNPSLFLRLLQSRGKECRMPFSLVIQWLCDFEYRQQSLFLLFSFSGFRCPKNMRARGGKNLFDESSTGCSSACPMVGSTNCNKAK